MRANFLRIRRFLSIFAASEPEPDTKMRVKG